MRLSLFAGMTAGLLWTSCARRTEPPAEPPPYSEDLRPLEASLLKDLRSRGVPSADIDRDCPVVRHAEDGAPSVGLEGKPGDRNLRSCEVDEYVLDHDVLHPDLAKRLTGPEIPWALEHPEIPATIALLDRILSEKGLRPDSPDYRRRKAFGLFLLATVPFSGWEDRLDLSTREARAKNRTFRDALRALAQKATEMGLEDLNLRLEAKGGLGTLSDFSVEHSAAEAVKTGVGDCTEMSKILFAIFRKAGFEPFFVRVDPWASEHPGVRELIQADPNYFHVVIGLKFDGATVLYDPGLVAHDPPHRRAAPLTLRQYASLDWVNRGIALAQEGKDKEAADAYDAANRLDAFNDAVFVDRSVASARKGDLDAALAQIEEAIALRPSKAEYYYYRGLVRVRRREPSRAIADFDLAIRKNPDNPLFYYDRGVTRGNTGAIAAAIDDLTVYARISPSPDVEKVRKYLAFIFDAKWTQSQLAVLRDPLQSELGVTLAETEARVNAARILWDAKAGKPEEADFRARAREEAKVLLSLKARKKPLSDPARQFLTLVFGRLPEDIRADPAFEAKRKAWLGS